MNFAPFSSALSTKCDKSAKCLVATNRLVAGGVNTIRYRIGVTRRRHIEVGNTSCASDHKRCGANSNS